MAVHSFQKIQCIPADLPQVWSFFIDAAKLPSITPPSMRFEILSPHRGDRIYAGQVIEYRLRPLPWFRVYWMTEITQVQAGDYFVDEQRRGPYSLWHHQHHFRKIEGGVEMTDIVHYEVPFGFIGGWANALFVRRTLDELFRYRRQRVEEIFGRFPG
jgi:ligand-binding SRPBCC domain-containing protein